MLCCTREEALGAMLCGALNLGRGFEGSFSLTGTCRLCDEILEQFSTYSCQVFACLDVSLSLEGSPHWCPSSRERLGTSMESLL